MEGCEDQQILERLGLWLREVRGQAADAAENSPLQRDATLPAENVGLYQLVEAFTALRHEVNLQTRSTRGLEDQTKSELAALQQAIDAL